MKKTTYLIITVIILILVVIFTLQNTSEINVNLFIWDIKTSLALLMFSLFSFGVVVALFVIAPTLIALKSTIKKDEKTISELQENAEISQKENIDNEE
jgi:uncharacterized integral membrane protein